MKVEGKKTNFFKKDGRTLQDLKNGGKIRKNLKIIEKRL